MTEQDRDFLTECIRYVEEHGYRVTRARKPASRQLTGKRLLTEHKGHRAEGIPPVDVCRLCRFGAAVRAHAGHTGDVAGCFLCLDRRTQYLYPSSMRTGDRPELAEVIARHHAAA